MGKGPHLQTEHPQLFLLTVQMWYLCFCLCVGHCNCAVIQENLDDSKNSMSRIPFIMANSNSFFEFLRNSSDSSRKQIFKTFFLFFFHEVVLYVVCTH